MKKSQSEVITTILLILLVLAAIIIVWNVVNRVVKKGAEGVGIEAITVNLEIQKVTLFVTGGAQVKVHRESGKGEITELKFVFEKEDGESEIITTNNPEDILDELETKVIEFSADELPFNNSEIEKVSLAPMFGENAGTQVYEPTPETDSSGDRILDAPDGTISWWKFDGNFQDSVGGNHGTAFGNASTNGNVLNLNGNGDYVNVGSDQSLKTNDNFTISVWIKTNFEHTGQGDIISSGITTTPYPYAIRAVGTKARFIIYDGTNFPLVDSTINISDNSWHQITGVRNTKDDKLYLYFDGIYNNFTTDSTTGRLNNTLNNLIGARTTTSIFFNGTIDEVMIFNKALSADEIKAIYNNQNRG